MPNTGNPQLISLFQETQKIGHVSKWRFVVGFEVFIKSGTSNLVHSTGFTSHFNTEITVVTITTGDNLAYLIIYYMPYIAIGSIHLCVTQLGHSKKTYKTGEIVLLRNLAGLSTESQYIIHCRHVLS